MEARNIRTMNQAGDDGLDIPSYEQYADECKHFLRCPACNQTFDSRNPYDALGHGWPGHRRPRS